jgi:restriction endonuclease S subunit
MEMKISQIADIITGHTFRYAIEHDNKGNFWIVQAKNINSGIDLNLDFTKTDIGKTRTKGLVKKNDILLTNRGTFRAAIYEGKIENLIAASSVFILRINEKDKILPEYLAIYLNSQPGQHKLKSECKGATIKSLAKSSLSEIIIPVPSIKNQKMIIGIYKNYTYRMDMYEREADLHKEIAEYTINQLITSKI